MHPHTWVRQGDTQRWCTHFFSYNNKPKLKMQAIGPTVAQGTSGLSRQRVQRPNASMIKLDGSGARSQMAFRAHKAHKANSQRVAPASFGSPAAGNVLHKRTSALYAASVDSAASSSDVEAPSTTRKQPSFELVCPICLQTRFSLPGMPTRCAVVQAGEHNMGPCYILGYKPRGWNPPCSSAMLHSTGIAKHAPPASAHHLAALSPVAQTAGIPGCCCATHNIRAEGSRTTGQGTP